MLRADTGDLIVFLNSLAEMDPVAMGKLVAARVPCSQELADHPTVQVGPDKTGGHVVGILGILNGYCGTIEDGKFKGWGAIAAIIERDGRCTGFCSVDSEHAARAAAAGITRCHGVEP